MHQRAWQNIAASRGCQYDTLAQLLARPITKSVASKDPLTVDMGWLIERILDVIAMPDLVKILSISINHSDINRRGFERLNNIEREIISIPLDLRVIKDEAYRENSAANVAGTPSRKVARPFQRLIAVQVDKH